MVQVQGKEGMVQVAGVFSKTFGTTNFVFFYSSFGPSPMFITFLLPKIYLSMHADAAHNTIQPAINSSNSESILAFP